MKKFVKDIFEVYAEFFKCIVKGCNFTLKVLATIVIYLGGLGFIGYCFYVLSVVLGRVLF